MCAHNDRFQNSICIAALLCAGVATPAVADDTSIDAMRDCRSIGADDERVACYDAIVDALAAPAARLEAAAEPDPERPPAAPAVESAPAAATPPAAAAAASAAGAAAAATDAGKSAEDSFGLPPEVAADRPDEIELTIAELTKMSSGRIALTATNGQVWRQTTSSTLRLREGDVVVIRRGSLGSHKLTMAGTNRSMKVKRVR